MHMWENKNQDKLFQTIHLGKEDGGRRKNRMGVKIIALVEG